jgi:hypothetical protein
MFERLNVDAKLLNAMPEAALINTKQFCRLDLNTAHAAQGLDDETLLDLSQSVINGSR